MKSLSRLIILGALLLVGCEARVQFDSKPNPAHREAVTAEPSPELTDQGKINLLRAEAHKRGLKWRVICMDWVADDEPNQFLAEAAPRDGAFSPYTEEGSRGLWIEEGHTQVDAAYALYQSIQGPQTHPAGHRESKHKNLRICPPALRGE